MLITEELIKLAQAFLAVKDTKKDISTGHGTGRMMERERIGLDLANLLASAAPSLDPQVVVAVSGGLVQGMSANMPVSVLVVDYDVDGSGECFRSMEGDACNMWKEVADEDGIFEKQLIAYENGPVKETP